MDTDGLKRNDHSTTASYLQHDEDATFDHQNLNFTTSSHTQSLSVQDSPNRKTKRYKKTYDNTVDDSEHLTANEISAISPIDSLSHSSGNTIAVPATTIPYMPVMGYQSYDYLLRSDGTTGTTTTTSQSDVSHNNNNQVQFGLPWISGGYPSSIPVVQVDPNQYQEMLMQQMRYADVRVLQRPDAEATTPDGTPGSDKRIANAVIPTAYPYTGGRFFLVEQPNVRQRKSYKNENRYILPNPLTICAREEGPDEKLPKILDGTVSVKLVNADGQELPPSKQNVLVSPDGALTLNLDRNNSAHFSLKVLETSEGTMFRLLFVVNFTLENVGTIEERILSRPFQVYSNRKKNSKAERPIVLDMKPMEGPISSETEIWIKGRGFCDKVVVLFGDKVGRVVETSENLITVYAPSRFDLPTNTPVNVTVSNRTQQDILSAEKQITFLYYVG